MAKALLGYMSNSTDPRIVAQLTAENRRLRQRVADLEAHVLRLQAENDKLAAILGPIIRAILRKGGIVISDQALTTPGLAPLPLPEGVKPGRYFMNKDFMNKAV